ncbi:MAG: prepilin-type N-terminal cleavage/methylation domain-containing protein [Bacilli bacterium]|nr:prepilin-type N-terminal cleavage/methylation domain-containing protein [Bacilli bacterium]
MKKSGFTLIELLAVIVILAIIALIATPIILGIISDAKKESQERSAELYLSGVELAIARRNLTEEFSPEECTITQGVVTCAGYEEPLVVEVDGEVPVSGTIKFENNKAAKDTTLTFEGFSATINEEGKLELSDGTSEITTPTSKICEVTEGSATQTGAKITCTLSNNDVDNFYLLQNDGTYIYMLTEYNIDLINYVQSASAGTISYYSYLDSDILENYVAYLNSNGLVNVTGSLISEEQSTSVECLPSNASQFWNSCNTTLYPWINNSCFWFSTGDWFYCGGLANDGIQHNDNVNGIRPVIKMLASDL